MSADLRQAMRQVLRVLPFLVLFSVLAASTLGQDGLETNHRLRDKLRAVDEQIARLEADNARLAQQIEALETNRHRQEALVRERMNGVREDEVLFLFLEATDDPADQRGP